MVSLVNNGIIICWLAFQTSNHNSSNWFSVTLPVAFKSKNIPVGNTGWWGSTFNTLRNQLTKVDYMIWDYKNNTGQTQVQVVIVGY